jgi:CRP-like cAMP-binding protein
VLPTLRVPSILARTIDLLLSPAQALDNWLLQQRLPVLTNPLILKLACRDQLSDEEKQVLEGAIARTVTFRADEDMVREGDRPAESKLLLEGFAARYKILENGRRKITNIHVPGDFVDLHSFTLKTMDHSILVLSDCTVGVVPHEVLHRISKEHPHLTRLLWLNTTMDGAIHRQWLVTLGRQAALGQFAHLICELFLRLQVVGWTDGHRFRLPITQAELGDALGLSTVHVNRTLQELRAEGLVTWSRDLVSIEDWDRLCEVAQFNPDYLNLQCEPR